MLLDLARLGYPQDDKSTVTAGQQQGIYNLQCSLLYKVSFLHIIVVLLQKQSYVTYVSKVTTLRAVLIYLYKCKMYTSVITSRISTISVQH